MQLAHELQLGELIQGYRVRSFIRTHHHIYVYEVEEVDASDEKMILKAISLTEETPMDYIDSFNNEIRVLSSIDHPLFATYLDSFLDASTSLLW